MDRLNRLALSDVRDVFRLVGDLRALGRDPRAWSEHMAAELLRLVGAKAAFVGEGYAGPGGMRYAGFIAAGLTDAADQRGLVRFMSSPEVAASRFMRLFADNYRRRFIASRDMVFADAEWYRSDYYEAFRAPTGLDAWLHSQVHLPFADGMHLICLSRPPGDRTFTPRDRRLLKLFHDELHHLWDTPPQFGDQPPEVATLPPRLRETLDRLRAGDAEKQVAEHLGVSYHAVHANVKRLHRWFGVSSRGELLGKLEQTAEYDFRPRLHGPPADWRRTVTAGPASGPEVKPTVRSRLVHANSR